jgi:uroporphyrinogen decarboxylase
MKNPLQEKPAPNFDEFEQVLMGNQMPKRVHLVEMMIDQEILQAIYECYLQTDWIPMQRWTDEPQNPYFQQLITLYYRLGYDYVPTDCYSCWTNHPQEKKRRTLDTAVHSRGERQWVENRGLISSWQDFDAFPWKEIHPDISHYDYLSKNLPDGMKLTVSASHFESVMERLLGFENLFFMLYDNPDLVEEVFNQWGHKVFDYYRQVIGIEEVGAIFHADDMGHKTSSIISPNKLGKFVLPWLKKYAALAHDYNKMFFIHSCGNHYSSGLIEDLIEEVKIDGFHSFQDIILPVAEFKAQYGERVATLGGVDVDKLSRMDEANLRDYIRNILELCMPGGRYALGSGNSVTNYVPLENYCIMLEEARAWTL